MGDYKVKIEIDAKSAANMRALGYELYALKGASVAINADPVVWFTYKKYKATNIIEWSKQYAAYTADDEDDPEAPVTSYNAVRLALGKQLAIDSKAGTGQVKAGRPGVYSVYNGVKAKFRAGLAEIAPFGKTFSPLCVFPLMAGATVEFLPVEKIALFFATGTIDQGAVLTRARSAGVLINLTESPTREIRFSEQESWHGWPSRATWVQEINSNEDLVKLLIQRPGIGYAPEDAGLLAAGAEEGMLATGAENRMLLGAGSQG